MAHDVKLDKVAIWFNKDDGRVYLTIDDPRLVNEEGKFTGCIFPLHAERHPKQVKRLAALLAREGVPIPSAAKERHSL